MDCRIILKLNLKFRFKFSSGFLRLFKKQSYFGTKLDSLMRDQNYAGLLEAAPEKRLA